MKFKIILLNIVLSLTLVSFCSCTVEGEEICGIWNVNGNYGEMQVEITPWKGKFLAYLLAYKNGSETIKGDKTEEFIFITDLVLNEGKYHDGKIYFDPNSKTHCALKMELLDHNQLKAVYDCDGQTSEEIWYRKGFNAPQESAQTPSIDKEIKEATAKKDVVSNISNDSTEKNEVLANSKTKKTAASPAKASKPSTPQIEGETKKQPSFYIIGIQAIVKYDDYKAMEKTIEALWTKAYNDGLSAKLENISEANKMYVSYSDYDKPKGKMTITLGYKVQDLSSIPSGLKGVHIPSNEYLVYPMSGDKSDFEGKGWEQLGELMMYRKAKSADFEVYTFDNSYNVKKAAMWMATK